jgi:hypothetical protein
MEAGLALVVLPKDDDEPPKDDDEPADDGELEAGADGMLGLGAAL